LSWIDWELNDEARSLHDFVARLIALRRRHPSFRRRSFFRGSLETGDGAKDVVWLRPDGPEMIPADWEGEHVRCLGMLFSGTGLIDVGQRGEHQSDDDFLLLVNAHHEPVPFVLPERAAGWTRVVDTARDEPEAPVPDSTHVLEGRSLALFRSPTSKGEETA
jgi:isoamylase